MSQTHAPISKVVIAPPGSLGIRVGPMDDGQPGQNLRGLFVLNVDPKSALVGKICAGDCIVTLDGEQVKGSSDLAAKKEEGRLLGIVTHEDQQRMQANNRAIKSASGTASCLFEFTVEPVGAPLGLLLDDKHVVVDVVAGSPLEGKVWKNDKIVTVNGVSVATLNMAQLANHLASLQQQFEAVCIKVERDAKRKRSPQKKKAAPGGACNLPLDSADPNLMKPEEDNKIDFLSPSQGHDLNKVHRLKYKYNREQYPAMLEYGVSLATNDEESRKLRQTLLSELIRWNDRHKVEQEFLLSPSSTGEEKRARLFWVPCGHGPKLSEEPDMPTKKLLDACRRSHMFDETVHAIAKYFQLENFGQGIELVMQYYANTQPTAFEKYRKVAQNVLWEQETARKRNEAARERQKRKQQEIEEAEASAAKPSMAEDVAIAEQDLELPPDYQDYDGSGDVKWNLRYMDLKAYHQQHGHCMVSTREVPLGKWVAWQRESHRKQYAALSDRRRELLDALGFVWEAKHVNRKPYVETGDPRMNKALTLKIVYEEQLTDQQYLEVAGFTTPEFEHVRNSAHPWRNGLVVLKKRLDARLKTMQSYLANKEQQGGHVGGSACPRRKCFCAVDELLEALQDTSVADRFTQIFGSEKAKLLQEYLLAATAPQQQQETIAAPVPSPNHHHQNNNDNKKKPPKRKHDDVEGESKDFDENNGQQSHHSLIDGDPASPPLGIVETLTYQGDDHSGGGSNRDDGASTATARIGPRGTLATPWESTGGPTTPAATPAGTNQTLENHQEEQSPTAWRRGYVLPTAAYGPGGSGPAFPSC